MLKTLLKSEISDEISESVVVRMCYIVCKLWSMNHFDPQEHKEKMSLAYTFQGGYRALS